MFFLLGRDGLVGGVWQSSAKEFTEQILKTLLPVVMS